MEDNGKLVENGHFRVFNDGTIHRIKNGIEKPITPTVFSSHCDKRLMTSFTENGKQKAFYVSRLVAEAYIHPLKKGQVVRYCDGNTLNVKASNLYIADQAEVYRQSGKKMQDTRWKRYGHKCARCGKPTVSKNNLCHDCTLIVISRKKHKERALRRESMIADKLANINPSLLTDAENKIIDLRRSGKTYIAISKELGLNVSREYIRQIINKCIVISNRGYRRKKYVHTPEYIRKRQRKQQNDLKQKIEKLEICLAHYKQQLEEIESTTEAVSEEDSSHDSH